MQLRRGLLTLASAQCAAAEETPGGGGGNCTDAAVDVLCAPETGLSECADVVAYFNLTAGAAPVMVASRTYTSQLSGFTFRFSSAHNKAVFDEDPWAFAPAYGGF
jgi:hypothetical protein